MFRKIPDRFPVDTTPSRPPSQWGSEAQISYSNNNKPGPGCLSDILNAGTTTIRNIKKSIFTQNDKTPRPSNPSDYLQSWISDRPLESDWAKIQHAATCLRQTTVTILSIKDIKDDSRFKHNYRRLRDDQIRYIGELQSQNCALFHGTATNLWDLADIAGAEHETNHFDRLVLANTDAINHSKLPVDGKRIDKWTWEIYSERRVMAELFDLDAGTSISGVSNCFGLPCTHHHQGLREEEG